MAKNTLQGIIYQHVVYGAGTILTGRSDIRAALVQPEELEAAILHAKPLFDAHYHKASDSFAPDHKASDSVESSDTRNYDLASAHSDLQQILDVYNATVIDGRFIDDLATDPKSVAEKLDVGLSESAVAALLQAGATVAGRFAGSFALAINPRIVAIAITVVIAIRAEEKPYKVVVDSSGLIKV